MTDAITAARTRFAPSPTGALHFGSVRTALFAWLHARSTGGQFILRIEDTDQQRYIPDTEALIMETLLWLGLNWDEGPETGGKYGPYIQSKRLSIYQEHAQILEAKGAAYWCSCTPQRLHEMREAQKAAHQPTRYDRHCLTRQAEVRAQREAGTPSVLRQLIPDGTTTWNDLVRGSMTFENSQIDDQVLLKSDGFPTYHLAVVVDDHLMEISDVIRADEWLPSTPKHLNLYSAFGWTPPNFAHVPQVLGDDRQKLSKRRGARNVLEYGELGYLPEAIVNAMALLGWSSGTGQEIFTPEELIQVFSLHRIHDSPAVFDGKRLDAINAEHIRRMPTDELIERLEFHLPRTSKETRRQLIPMLRERMVTLRDATELAAPLLGDVDWEASFELPKKVDAETAVALIDATIAEVEAGGLNDVEGMRLRLTEMLKVRGSTARDGFRVLYQAILGKPQGVPVFDAMAFLGTDAVLKRLRLIRWRISPPAK